MENKTNQNLNDFLEALRNRNKAIEERRVLEQTNKTYLQDMQSLGVMIFTSSYSETKEVKGGIN